MFKFSFSDPDQTENDETPKSTTQWFESEEILPDPSKYQIQDLLLNARQFKCKPINLIHLSSDVVLSQLRKGEDDSNCILKAETDHSDLITSKYEGGLKIWECTRDLINYLDEENIEFSEKTVLDLGCGAGMLGIYPLLQGSSVDFQDYNKEVITYTTIPNVILNTDRDQSLDCCKFYSGDWKSFINLNKVKYDFILTSETIYNFENYDKLIELFDQLLKSDGIIFLAAKTYYFGVGGGTRLFEKKLKMSGKFSSEVVWKISDGVQREILKIIK